MVDTTEVICDVAYDYSQLAAGQTLFDLAANESLVIRDFTWSNPSRRGVNFRLNGASWRAFTPCDYSWRQSGTEIIQADAIATLSTPALPIFGNLMRFYGSSNGYTLLGQPTIFTDQLTNSPQNVAPLGGMVTSPAVSPALSVAGPRCAFFDASGNFYYTLGTTSKSAAYRRVGGLAGAEASLFGGATILFMALDIESGIIYAATSATTLKRYNTTTSTQLADVTLASVPFTNLYSAFAVRGGLMMSWIYNEQNIFFSNATSGALLGTVQHATDGSGSLVYSSTGSPFITKTSTGVYKAYFGYYNVGGNGERGLSCINCGAAPLTTWSPTRVNRTGEILYTLAYSPQSQIWSELPYSNSYTQDLVLALDGDTGSEKTIWLFNKLTDTVAYKFTVPSLPNAGGALIALGSTAQAVADFGTVRCKITGIKTK